RTRTLQEREIYLRPGVCFLPSLSRRLSPGGEWGRGEVDWRSIDKPKLWRYNLHYFDYLLDEGRSKENRFRLIDHWIECNPPGTPDAWEPFPVSLRVVNWINFFCREDNRGCIKPEWLKNLYTQILWLEKNIERHLLANHYFRNGKALVFGGLFFSGNDAERWLKKGMSILSSEIEEQILPDGGHFERSPMYHSMILEDCLDLLNLRRAYPGLLPDWSAVAGRMLGWLNGMSHPDGQISFFNDSAFGVAPG